MIALIKTLQVILALSLLIIIHEAGHFLWARIFHIRVDKFFLFFDVSGVKLFSTRMAWFQKLVPASKNWETEYGIGWLPLGGYCKIAGMIDESMDTEALKQPPQPWEFRTKPAWQRLLVMFGGVLNNFILAVLLFIAILAAWGRNYMPNDSPIYVNELSYEMGFRTGDRILRFDDYVPEDFLNLQVDLARRQARKVTVLRGADTLDIYIDQAMMPQILNSPDLFSVAVPFVVDTIPPASPNFGAGFRKDDRITAINGESIRFVQDSREILADKKGEEVPVTVVREGDTLSLTMKVDTLGRALIYAQIPGLMTREYNAISAIPAGIRLTGETIGGYLDDLKMVATPSTGAYKSVGSFIAIGQVFPGNWDWNQFLYLLGLLSIMLGVMNLLPIPGLDGGHILFTIYEMITGRKPSDKFLIVAQMIGMFLLLMLMILAFGNDIGRLIG